MVGLYIYKKKEILNIHKKGIEATYKTYLILITDQRVCHIKHTPIYLFGHRTWEGYLREYVYTFEKEIHILLLFQRTKSHNSNHNSLMNIHK